MIQKLIIWLVIQSHKRKIRKAISKDLIIAIKGLLENYMRAMRTDKILRSTYIKEMKNLGLFDEKFVEKFDKLHKRISSYLHINGEVYVAYCFLKKGSKLDMRKKKDCEYMDEMVYNFENLISQL